jgi:hypothetical protein
VKLTKHRDYETRIRFTVFSGYVIHFVISGDMHNSVRRRYPQYEWSDGHADALTFHAEGGHGHVFMKLETFHKPYYAAGIISHEMWHAVRQMLFYVGVAGTHEDEPLNNEVVAYHLGFAVERATKFAQEVTRDHAKRRTKSTTASKGRNRR